MIKGTRHLGLCYGKPVVEPERETFLTIGVGSGCGEGASVPVVKVWGGTSVTPQTAPLNGHTGMFP